MSAPGEGLARPAGSTAIVPSNATDGPTARTGNRLGPPVVAAAAMASLAYLGVVDPNTPGHYPTCPFLAITGLYCPGCGTLRAVHALAHGDVVAALSSNVLAVAALPFVLFLWVQWVRRTYVGAPARRPLPVTALAVLGVVAVVFAVLRNTTGGSWLAP